MVAVIEKDLIVERIRKYGGSSSDAILDPSCQIFSIPDVDGLIGYRTELDSIVVFGDPVCSVSNIPTLVNAFHKFCEDQRKNIIYLSASENFAQWAIKNVCHIMVEAGHELHIDPHHDPRSKTGTHASLVRRKVRHALKENVVVKEYRGGTSEVEEAIKQVGNIWLKTRRGPQIYISHVHLFEHTNGKRWFYAQKDSQIVGVVVINQLQSKNGWLLNHLMTTPDAPHGTPELLVITALETVRNEGCHFVTFGSVPPHHLGKFVGMGKMSAWITKIIFQFTRFIFHLDGHNKFWEKFNPDSNHEYILFSNPHVKIRDLIGLMKAMNVSV